MEVAAAMVERKLGARVWAKGGRDFKGDEEAEGRGARLPVATLDKPVAAGVRHRPCCPIHGRAGTMEVGWRG